MRRFVTADEFAGLEERQDLGVRTQGIVADLANSSGRLISYVLSDTSVGRDNHIVAATAWQLDNFLRNPVMPWAHDTSQPTIAKWVEIASRGNRLVGTAEYADRDTYPFADTIFRLVKGGFLSAVSTSWIPLEWKFTTDRARPGGVDFAKVDLLECSQVPVPALPSALVTARAQGIDTTPLVAWAERMLDGGALAVLPRQELEKLRREAKAPVGNRRQRRAEKFRANPNHDDEGRFASGGGGGGAGGSDDDGGSGGDDEAGDDAKGPEDFDEKDQAKLSKLHDDAAGHVADAKAKADQIGGKIAEIHAAQKDIKGLGKDLGKSADKAEKAIDKINDLYQDYGLDGPIDADDFNAAAGHLSEINDFDLEEVGDSVKTISQFKHKRAVAGAQDRAGDAGKITHQGEADMTKLKPAKLATKRSLYHVSWLASLLSDLGCIQGSAAFESEIFETDSAIPAQLLDALKSLGAVLVAMTSEEVSKLLAGRDDDDAAALTFDVVEMSATGAAVRSNAMRLMRRLDDVALLALSGAMRQHIQGRKVSFQVGDVVTPVTPVTRAGRVISAENERCLRSAHDHMTQATEIVRGVVDQVGDEDADGDREDDPDSERAIRERRARAIALSV